MFTVLYSKKYIYFLFAILHDQILPADGRHTWNKCKATGKQNKSKKGMAYETS